MSKRRETVLALALLTFVSGLCLSGLKAVDKRIMKKEEREKAK